MPLVLGFVLLLGGVLLLSGGVTGASFADVLNGSAGEIYRRGQTTAKSAASAAEAGTGGGSGQGSGGGVRAPSSATPSALAMLTAAKAAVAAHLSYSTSVQSSGLLAGFRADCSGFVSWVLHKGGVNVGDAVTGTLPSQLQAGQGSQVTVWDRPQAGEEGHAIINILGQWFESGGQINAGIVSMTPAQAAAELGVSSVADLGAGTTGNGFEPLHPSGL